MNSSVHAGSSLLTGVVLAWVGPPTQPLLLAGVVLTVGVAVDLDHFLIARLRTGSWTHARRVLADPTLVVVDQSAIFEEGAVGRWNRLLSHLLVGGLGTATLWALGLSYWAAVVAITLYVHVTTDVIGDRREIRAPASVSG